MKIIFFLFVVICNAMPSMANPQASVESRPLNDRDIYSYPNVIQVLKGALENELKYSSNPTTANEKNRLDNFLLLMQAFIALEDHFQTLSKSEINMEQSIIKFPWANASNVEAALKASSEYFAKNGVDRKRINVYIEGVKSGKYNSVHEIFDK